MKLTAIRCLTFAAVLSVVLSMTTGLTAATAAFAAPAASAARAAPAAAAIGAPVARGTLRIAGSLRDGGVVRGTGLSWRPGALPAGDRLLSFEVGYAWSACKQKTAGRPAGCVAAADATATPYAARRYHVGHVDTGRYLRLRVTAAEVVETDPATFAFKIIRTSVIAVTGSRVRGYPAGQPPVTEFLNGLPERQTGSRDEYFQVITPHFAAADGEPVQRYRIDQGPWHAMPASRVFYTGRLGLGEHQVTVRTANRAGATTLRFRWRVTPLPAPRACTRPGGRPCWYPPHLNSAGHPMRWDWQIGRVTPLQRTGARAVDIYDIDGFLTTPAEVSQIHHRWQAATLAHPKAVCYLDLAWEDYRPDASQGQFVPPAALGKVYYGYPQERWVDFRQLDQLKPMLDERISMCARKGFDAVELDDIDSYDPPGTTGFQLSVGDAQNFLAWALNDVHAHGMAVLWKNAPGLARWGVRYADGAVVEECYTYGGCPSWDVFTADHTTHQPTGKWVGEAEYGADHFVCNPGQKCPGRRSYARYCQAVYAPPNGFAAVKFDVDLDGAVFLPCPRGT